MKILNFKISRQTILLLLLVLVSAFEVAVAYSIFKKEICQPSSKVKAVMLFERTDVKKLLQVKKMNNSTQIVLSNYSLNDPPELYMFTLPPPAWQRGRKKQIGGQFLLYDPLHERFVCKAPRNQKQKRNFITQEYPNLNRCSFTESTNPMVSGYVQYLVGKHVLLNKKNYYSRITVNCSCPKIEFHKRMMALAKKRRYHRHQQFHKILDGLTITPEDIARCNEYHKRH